VPHPCRFQVFRVRVLHPGIANPHPFNAFYIRSSAIQKVIDTRYTFMLFSGVFADQNSRHPFSIPTISAACPTLPRHFPTSLNSFRINTYEIPRKCCNQRTYGKAKPFRCNTYKKQGGGVCYAHPTRMRILSDYRESKDSSPVPLLARSFHSLHQECFTTLLQSTASALFLKTAGCIPTIPILELSARTNGLQH